MSVNRLLATPAEAEGKEGDWRNLVVICSGTAFDRWVSVGETDRVAADLVRAGALHRPPLDAEGAAEQPAGRLGFRLVGPRLAVLAPSAPPGATRPVLRALSTLLARHAIGRCVRSLGVSRASALVMASHMDLFGAVAAHRNIVYATDDFVAGAELFGLSTGYLRQQERFQAERADGVIVVSEALRERWRALGHDPVLIPNGCDTERFAAVSGAPWPEDVDLPRPIVGTFGHLSQRIDLETVGGGRGSRHFASPRGQRPTGLPLRPPAGAPECSLRRH